MADNYHILIRKLDEFIRKYYRNRVIRGTLLFLAILFFSSLLFVTVEYFLHTGILPRTILFYLFIVLNGASFLFFIADPLLKLRKIGRIISHEQAARIIGEHFGEIKDKLLNTLQLKRLENSAEENIEFVMSLQGRSKAQRKSRVGELLAGIGLPDRGRNRPAQLSGGQQQRVAVARALAPKPKFILADEPTANLDSKSAETLLDIMEKLNHEEKTTFIFSTHDPRVVAKAHRVITLEDGKIVSEIIKE